jgi:predicted metal-dependent peptidase
MPSGGNSVANNARQNLPSFGQFQPKAGSAAGQKKLKNDWEGTFIQSVAAMKGRGDLPAGIERLVNQLVSPSVNWWDVLRSWIREQCADDYDWLTPAMEYSDSGFILPSLKSERISSVVFALDTSGSISPEVLTRFRSEEQSCLDEMRPKTLVESCCDAKVQQVKEYSAGDTIGGPAPGGGGSVAQPIWDHVSKMSVQPKCIVMLTDCFLDFGTDPGIPVIFVSWEKGSKAPFGTVIEAQASP